MPARTSVARLPGRGRPTFLALAALAGLLAGESVRAQTPGSTWPSCLLPDGDTSRCAGIQFVMCPGGVIADSRTGCPAGVLVRDVYTLAANTVLHVASPGVLANDGPTTSIWLATPPQHASAFTFSTDGSFSYTPQAGFVGTDRFTYRATYRTSMADQEDAAYVTLLVTAPGLPPLLVCDDDVTLASQAEVDAFACPIVVRSLTVSGADVSDLAPLAGVTSLGGSLTIEGNPALTSLSPLANLAVVDGSLTLSRNPALTSLAGLVGLTEVGGSLVVEDNAGLTALTGLDALATVGGSLNVISNGALTSLAALGALATVGESVNLVGNSALASLAGLGELTEIGGDLIVFDHPGLPSLVGLENVTQVHGLYVGGNAALASMSGLASLTSVGGDVILSRNAALTSLTGLENADLGAGTVSVYENAALTSVGALSGLTSVGGDLYIALNRVLPSLSGLEGVTSVAGNLRIGFNTALMSVAALSNVTSVGADLGVTFNASLTSLDGLERITGVPGSLTVTGNGALTSLEGLRGLGSVGDLVSVTSNAVLPRLDGLDGITSAGRLSVLSNPALTDCACGLSGLISGDPPAFTGVPGLIFLFNNAPSGLCTSTETILANPCVRPPPVAGIGTPDFTVLLAPNERMTRGFEIANSAPPGAQELTYAVTLRNLTYVPAGLIPAPRPVRGAAARTNAATPTRRAGRPSASAAPASSTARRGSGGPDAFGYTWTDSDEPGGPAVIFQSIAATGTPVTDWVPTTEFDPADEGYVDVALPFTFPFYGAGRTTVRVGTNGLLYFADFQEGTFAPAASFPSTFPPDGVIAPLWADLDLSAGGTVYTGTRSDGRFVVEYAGAAQFGVPGSSLTFQAILASNGDVEVQIGAASGDDAVLGIGIEDDGGTDGLTVAFGTLSPSSVAHRAVQIRHPGLSWVSLPAGQGTIAPGGSRVLQVDFDATGLAEGTYTAELVVETNDPAAPSATFDLALTVGGIGVVSGGPGWRLLAAPATGLTVADLARRNLVQGVPGYYPPPQAQPNLFTGYDGTAFAPPASGTEALTPGRGFFWYLYDLDLAPGGPSNSVALPMTLETQNRPLTADTPVALHASGDRFNLLGNPFGVSLDVSAVSSWPGAGGLQSSVVQIWSAASGSYDVSLVRPVIAPWQGFVAEATAASTLTIPTAAQATGGVLQRAAAGPMIALELAAAGSELRDRAAVLTFGDDALDGPDPGDASKLAPMAGAFVQAAFESTGADGESLLRAVDNRPMPTEGVVEIPLHVLSVGAGSDLVLSWPRVEALPAEWTLTLVDHETGTITDLRSESRYAFAVAPQAARLAAPVAARAERTGSARFSVVVGPGQLTAGPAVASGLALALEAPRPNPAAGEARIGFVLPSAGEARVVLVDLLGREVAVLSEGERPAGRHEARVDPRGLAPGVYVVRLSADGQALTRRLVVAR